MCRRRRGRSARARRRSLTRTDIGTSAQLASGYRLRGTETPRTVHLLKVHLYVVSVGARTTSHLRRVRPETVVDTVGEVSQGRRRLLLNRFQSLTLWPRYSGKDSHRTPSMFVSLLDPLRCTYKKTDRPRGFVPRVVHRSKVRDGHRRFSCRTICVQVVPLFS